MSKINQNSPPTRTHEADIKLADAVKAGSASDIRKAVAEEKEAYESEYGTKDPEGYKKHIEWASQDQDLNKDSINSKGWDLAKSDVDDMFSMEKMGGPNITNPYAMTAKVKMSQQQYFKDVAYDKDQPQNLTSSAIANAISHKEPVTNGGDGMLRDQGLSSHKEGKPLSSTSVGDGTMQISASEKQNGPKNLLPDGDARKISFKVPIDPTA